jgi:hypothetical protein
VYDSSTLKGDILTMCIPQLKTRGQRSRLEDRADGEIDENFWAQAAADQAAVRAEDEINQSKPDCSSSFPQVAVTESGF